MTDTPGTETDASAAPIDPREAAIAALLALAADRDWQDIGLKDVADKAGLSLADLRGAYPSKGAILAAFARRIDRRVLAGADPAMAGEPARERLYDVLMRRLDALAPHREAVRRLSGAFARDPLGLAALNRVAVTSMQWMLAAAGIGSEGPLGAMRAQGLALAWSRILKVWLADTDDSLGRTMTEVDRQLRSGERWMERADGVWRMTRPLRRLAGRSCSRQSKLRERMRERFSDLAGRRPGQDAEGAQVL